MDNYIKNQVRQNAILSAQFSAALFALSALMTGVIAMAPDGPAIGFFGPVVLVLLVVGTMTAKDAMADYRLSKETN